MHAADVTLPNTAHELLLRAALQAFYDDFAACIDDDQLERLPDFFAEDALYRVTARENHDAGLPLGTIYCDGKGMIRDRILAIRESTVFEPRALRHFVTGLRLQAIEPGLLRTEANFLVLESMSDRDPRVLLVGRYIDAIRHGGPSFLLQERHCVYDNHRLLTSLIMPV